jgi:hypothetical protein
LSENVSEQATIPLAEPSWHSEELLSLGNTRFIFELVEPLPFAVPMTGSRLSLGTTAFLSMGAAPVWSVTSEVIVGVEERLEGSETVAESLVVLVASSDVVAGAAGA